MLFKKRPSWISQSLWLRLMRQRDRRKIWRRQARRFFKNPRLALEYFRYRKAIAAADWPRVKERTLAVADLARRTGDRQTIAEMVAALERVGCYRESADFWFSELASHFKVLPNEWSGEDLSGKTLLVHLNREPGQGLGIGYRCAHIVAKLVGQPRRTMVIVEPRLVPTYRRTFPALEIFTSLDGISADQIDFVALPSYLLMRFDIGAASASDNFQPLLVDATKAAQLREKYLATQRGNRKPLIGICWHSGHHGKDLPPLDEWRDFVARTDATFVSLQYGNITQDVKVIGGDRIIVDDSINQLVDMDDFSAQVAALDGVITVISTLANVGGALGVPTIVLRDDWFRRNLPYLSDKVPWFRSMRVAGKNRRAWKPVFDEALEKLLAITDRQRADTPR